MFEKSKFNLADFPYYTCVLYSVYNTPTKERITKGEVRIAPKYNGERISSKTYRIGPNFRSGSIWMNAPRGKLKEGDRLAFHPNCDIPISAVKKYETVSARSKEMPTKLVIPMRGGNLWGIKSAYRILASNVILFKSEVHKGIVAINLGFFTNNPTSPDYLTKEDFVRMFRNSLGHMYPVDYFELVDDGEPCSILSNISDLDYAILTRTIPQDMLISEKSVPINDKPITPEIIMSCYNLLRSPDQEVREAAMLTIAQHDIRPWQSLVWWLLNTFWDSIYYFKSRNSCFRWVCLLCEPECNYKSFSFEETLEARKFVEKLTEGNVYWNDPDNVVIVDRSSLKSKPGVQKLYDIIT